MSLPTQSIALFNVSVVPESATHVRALQTCVTAMTEHNQVVLQVWTLSLQLHPAAEVDCGAEKCQLSLRIIGKYDFTIPL